MKTFFTLVLLSGIALIMSCSNDNNKIENNNEFNQSVKAVVDATKSFKTLTVTPDNLMALENITGVQLDLQTIIDIVQSKQAYPLIIADTKKLQALDPSCYQVDDTAKKVTYTNCSYEANSSINGTIQATDTTATVDLTVTSTSGTATVTFTMGGSVTVSDTTVGGSLNFTYQVTPQLTYNVTTKFNTIAIDSNFCPTDGTLGVTATYTASGITKNVGVTAEFGPNCGDIVGTY